MYHMTHIFFVVPTLKKRTDIGGFNELEVRGGGYAPQDVELAPSPKVFFRMMNIYQTIETFRN